MNANLNRRNRKNLSWVPESVGYQFVTQVYNCVRTQGKDFNSSVYLNWSGMPKEVTFGKRWKAFMAKKLE